VVRCAQIHGNALRRRLPWLGDDPPADPARTIRLHVLYSLALWKNASANSLAYLRDADAMYALLTTLYWQNNPDDSKDL
jgi:hypothetical protein